MAIGFAMAGVRAVILVVVGTFVDVGKAVGLVGVRVLGIDVLASVEEF